MSQAPKKYKINYQDILNDLIESIPLEFEYLLDSLDLSLNASRLHGPTFYQLELLILNLQKIGFDLSIIQSWMSLRLPPNIGYVITRKRPPANKQTGSECIKKMYDTDCFESIVYKSKKSQSHIRKSHKELKLKPKYQEKSLKLWYLNEIVDPYLQKYDKIEPATHINLKNPRISIPVDYLCDDSQVFLVETTFNLSNFSKAIGTLTLLPDDLEKHVIFMPKEGAESFLFKNVYRILFV